MHTMCGNRVWAENAMLQQTIYGSQFSFIQAVIFIRLVFRSVDMKPRPFRCSGAASLQGNTGKRQAGVQAEGPCKARMRICCQSFLESYILVNSCTCLIQSVSICHFITKHTAPSAFIDCVNA